MELNKTNIPNLSFVTCTTSTSTSNTTLPIESFSFISNSGSRSSNWNISLIDSENQKETRSVTTMRTDTSSISYFIFHSANVSSDMSMVTSTITPTILNDESYHITTSTSGIKLNQFYSSEYHQTTDISSTQFSHNTFETIILYTQSYEFTDHSTTFYKGLPSTIILSTSVLSSAFSTPIPTITTDVAFYLKWTKNSRDQSEEHTRSNRVTVIGSVIGVLGGLLLCIGIIYLIFARRRKNRTPSFNLYQEGFSHEIGRRLDYQDVEEGPNKPRNANETTYLKKENTIINRSVSYFPTLFSKKLHPKTSDDDPFKDDLDFHKIDSIMSETNIQSPMQAFQQNGRNNLRLQINTHSFISSQSDSTGTSMSYPDDDSSSIYLEYQQRASPFSNNDHHVKSQSFLKELI